MRASEFAEFCARRILSQALEPRRLLSVTVQFRSDETGAGFVGDSAATNQWLPANAANQPEGNTAGSRYLCDIACGPAAGISGSVATISDRGVFAARITAANELTVFASGDIYLSSLLADLVRNGGFRSLVIQGSDSTHDTLIFDSSPGEVPLDVVFDGGGGNDAILGPQVDSNWQITGIGSGHVGDVTFANIENLVGAADNEDVFTFGANGRICGQIEGGARGYDTLVVNDPAGTATYDVAGPDSGTITVDGQSDRLCGPEPVTLADTTDVIVTTSYAGDLAVLEVDPDDSSKLRVSTTNGTMESVSFTPPSGSLRIDLAAGNDTSPSATFGSFDLGRLTVHGGGNTGDIGDKVVIGAEPADSDPDQQSSECGE